MKTGVSVQDLALEVQRQQAAKRDYIAGLDRLRFVVERDGGEAVVRLDGLPDGQVGVRKRAHDQISDVTGIPRKYYRRLMEDAPDLFTKNVNHWFEHQPKQRLVRTLDGDCRAMLSDRYRVLDNPDFVQAVVPVISELGGKIESCQLTEDRLYLKVVHSELRADILSPGTELGRGHDAYDEVNAGLVLSNSEIGCGRLSIAPAIHTVRCTNLAVFDANAMTRMHLGRRITADGDDASYGRYLSDETLLAQDVAIWNEVKDLARASLDGRVFNDLCAQLRAARGLEINDAQATIERVTKQYSLSDAEGSSVLDHLIRGGEMTAYGLHAAVTRASQDVASYDRASELETIGGEIVTLEPSSWKQLSPALN